MAVFDWSWFDDGSDEPGRRPTKITKMFKNEVWRTYVGTGKGTGRCTACERIIYQDEFEVGHNIAKSKGGLPTLANLRPVCRPCNSAMGTMSIEVYKRRFKGPATKKQPTGAKRKKR